MVEADDAEPLGAAAVATAAVIRGAWIPEHPLAGHKSTSYGAYRIAARQAAKRGAQIALLADDQGRLGEADTGNVVAVVDGELLTPARGVLPGIARAALIGAGLVRQAELGPEVLERSSELLMTNALRGVVALRSVEGEPWSRDTPGPRAEAAMQAFRRLG
jgi:branched-subunit amino acid aminotransferase/4-amino-4-deoxychorismate lyase